MDLLGSSSDNEEDVSFKINEGYAKNYDKWRKKEEKQKLLDKYGAADSSNSSSEEEEIRSTPQMDKDWLRAYAVVRFKQPRLYKEGETFFKDTAKPVSKKKGKATTLKDHERNFILEKKGIESDEDTESKVPQGKSYFEEQEEIKKNLKDAIGDSGDEDSDEGEDLLIQAHKTEEQKKQEENEYLEWLRGERESLGDADAEAELAPLKQYWNDPSLDEKEKVLRDYILNNGYMDQEESDSESDDGGPGQLAAPDPEEEEKFLEEAEQYEHKYNFRHEEPGGDEIRSYPRVIETSVRTKDTRRAEKRKQKLERKQREKEKMKEEIRLLQKLQMEEKIEKLGKLRQIAHRPDFEYDLDADFDPEQHSKIMKKYFNNDYYEDEDDDEKPTFEYDAAIDEEEDDWWKERLEEESVENDEMGRHSEAKDGVDTAWVDQRKEEEEQEQPDTEEPNFIMDADYDPTRDYKAEKKRAKKYGKALAKKLPIFDPSKKTFDEYIEEYVRDKIDDLPFTYHKVVPNDYGLTTEEILSLPDRELNAWVSVKKLNKHRSQKEELEERRRYQARAQDPNKKFKILPSLLQKPGNNPEAASKKKKKKRRKRKAEDEESELRSDVDEPPTKQMKKSEADYENDLETPAPLTGSSKKKKGGKAMKEHQPPAFADTSHSLGDIASTGENSHDIGLKNNPSRKRKRTSSGSPSETIKQTLCQAHNGRVINSGRDTSIATKKTKFKNAGLKKANSISDVSEINAPPSQSKVNKKKKAKKKNSSSETETQIKKKKKLSIKMNKKLEGSGASVVDTKNVERQLSKIMSASRMSKFGLGPKPGKETKKRKKKNS